MSTPIKKLLQETKDKDSSKKDQDIQKMVSLKKTPPTSLKEFQLEVGKSPHILAKSRYILKHGSQRSLFTLPYLENPWIGEFHRDCVRPSYYSKPIYTQWVQESFKEVLHYLAKKGAWGDFVEIVYRISREEHIKVFSEFPDSILKECAFGLLLEAMVHGDEKKLGYYLDTRKINVNSVARMDWLLFNYLTKSNSYGKEILITLLEAGCRADYANRWNQGFLHHLMVNKYLRYSNFLADYHPKKWYQDWWYDPGFKILNEIFALSLKQGANPMLCIHKWYKGIYFTSFSSLELLTRIPEESRAEFGRQKPETNIHNCFLQLLSFGGGLLKPGKRLANLESSRFDERRNREEFLKGVMEAAKQDIGYGSIFKTFQKNIETSEIVLLGETTDSKPKRVWIYTLKDLERALDVTNRDIRIPNLRKIIEYTFRTPTEDLAPGIHDLFMKYQKDLNLITEPSIITSLAQSHQRCYKEFKESLLNTPVVAGKEYFDFDKKSFVSAAIRKDIESYQPWLKPNILEVLSLLAKCNAEESFLLLAKTHHKVIGSELFLKFIRGSEQDFIACAGKLLLFLGVRVRDIKLIKHLMEDREIPLNIFLGTQQNSLLIELAKNCFRNPYLKVDKYAHDFRKVYHYGNYGWEEMLEKLTHQHAEEAHEIMKLLLEKSGKDSKNYASYRNQKGESALHHFSKREGNGQSMMMLLDKLGVNPLLQSKNGNLPLGNILQFYRYSFASLPMLTYGAGLAKREHRIYCPSLRFNISKILGVLQVLDRNLQATKEFSRLYFESDIAVAVKKENTIKTEALTDTQAKGSLVYAIHDVAVKSFPEEPHILGIEFEEDLEVEPETEAQAKDLLDYTRTEEPDIIDTPADTAIIDIQRELHFIFTLKELSDLLYLNRPEAALSKANDALSLFAPSIRRYVLEADDEIVDPKVKKLFAEEIRSFLDVDAVLRNHINSANCTDIIISYLNQDLSLQACLAFPQEKLKQLLEYNPEAPLATPAPLAIPVQIRKLNREQFILGQYKALLWKHNHSTGIDPKVVYGNRSDYDFDGKNSEFYKLLKLDDKDPANLAAMQNLIDNGLIALAQSVGRYSEILFQVIAEKRMGYLKMLVEAGADVNERSHPTADTALSLVLAQGDLQSAEILIDAGADLSVKVGGDFPDSLLSIASWKGKCEKGFIALLDKKGIILPELRPNPVPAAAPGKSPVAVPLVPQFTAQSAQLAGAEVVKPKPESPAKTVASDPKTKQEGQDKGKKKENTSWWSYLSKKFR